MCTFPQERCANLFKIAQIPGRAGPGRAGPGPYPCFLKIHQSAHSAIMHPVHPMFFGAIDSRWCIKVHTSCSSALLCILYTQCTLGTLQHVFKNAPECTLCRDVHFVGAGFVRLDHSATVGIQRLKNQLKYLLAAISHNPIRGIFETRPSNPKFVPRCRAAGGGLPQETLYYKIC